MSKKSKKPENQICANKKARHEYFIEETFEAGLSLQGWEVKAIRAGKMTITEAYIIFRNNEAFLFGAHIQPLLSSSTHVSPDSIRTRKLLLNRRELERLFVGVQQKGYTCVALSMYWSKHLIKCEIALGKGKKEYDKRQTLREKQDKREADRAISARKHIGE